jgi:hypothetical protein
VRIALASDAWAPQTNGVVTTLKCTAATLTALGRAVRRYCRARGDCLAASDVLVFPSLTDTFGLA